jgi:hypothetical protein
MDDRCCIKDVSVLETSKSWCGRDLYMTFRFTDIDHAALNGRRDGRLLVCKDCLKLVVSALRNNYCK